MHDFVKSAVLFLQNVVVQGFGGTSDSYRLQQYFVVYRPESYPLSRLFLEPYMFSPPNQGSCGRASVMAFRAAAVRRNLTKGFLGQSAPFASLGRSLPFYISGLCQDGGSQILVQRGPRYKLAEVAKKGPSTTALTRASSQAVPIPLVGFYHYVLHG